MTTRVLLVRHAASVVAAEDRFAGATDVGLSAEGESQAERLAVRLAKVQLAGAYSSPLVRARRTVEMISSLHGIEPQIVSELREIHHGHWEQLTRAEVQKNFEEEYRSWSSDPFKFAPSGGETGESVLARARPAFQRIIDRHADQSVLIVSHKATIRLLIANLLGFDPTRYRDRLDQQPCCLNIIDFDGASSARLMLFNDVSHYENGSLL